MKRLDIIQVAIIIAGITSVLFFVEAVPSFLIYIFRWFDEGLRGGTYMRLFISSIINLAAYSLLAIYAFKYSKSWAERLCDKTDLNSEINIKLDKKELLVTVFIAMAVYGLIKNIPQIFYDLYKLSYAGETLSDEVSLTKHTVKGFLIEDVSLVVLHIVLLVYAKVFADFFSKKINNIEPPDSINVKEEY